MATTESMTLRARAVELRRLAHAIESTPALILGDRAGDDTWRGARPTFCTSTLAGHRTGLLDAASHLRHNARTCDVRADEAERVQSPARTAR